MSTLTLRQISKSFGALLTLRNIDLTLGDGEFLVLLGESGCGKSTLLSLISGLMEPSSGDIILDGKSLKGVSPKDRDIAMVFQSYALYPNLSVARNIGFGLEMRGVAKSLREAEVAEVAKTLQITHLLERRPAVLSGGQRQRVAIGRAMVRKPKLFLFDEPLSNLDARLRAEMRAEIKRLHQMLGVTIIYVTHDQIEAMTLATRIAVMREGRIEQIGPPEEIYRNPLTTFVASFVGSPSMNMLEGEVSAGQVRLRGGEGAMRVEIPDTRPVTVAIRPEDIRTDGMAAKGFGVTAQIEMIEFTGPEKIVTLATAGQRFIATFPADIPLRTGEEIRAVLPYEKTMIFDSATGLRLPI